MRVRDPSSTLGIIIGINQTSNELMKVNERLATGQRINSSADDSAGLAVASLLDAESKLSKVAYRNVNDAISLTNIALGALDAQETILQRLAEISEQASNGIYSNEQRAAYQSEFSELRDEFNRIGTTTKFNNQKLLDVRSDGRESFSFQIGIKADATGRLQVATEESSSYSGEIVPMDSPLGGGSNDSLDTLLELFGSSLMKVDVEADYFGENSKRSVALVFGYDSGSGFLYVSHHVQNATDGVVEDTYNSSGLLGAFSVNQEKGQIVDLLFGSGEIDEDGSYTTPISFGDLANAELVIPTSKIRFAISGNESDSVSSTLEIAGVETQLRAQMALEVVEKRRELLSEARSNYGAVQSRLEVALRTTQTHYLVKEQARSRLIDRDIASDIALSVSLGVRRQTGAALLAQSARSTETVLQLLNF